MEKTRVYNTSWVAGVDDVDDSALEVKFWAKDENQREMTVLKDDEEIEDAVKDAFLYDPRVLSFKIDVDGTMDWSHWMVRLTI